MVLSVGTTEKKIPVTPQGIDPGTVQLELYAVITKNHNCQEKSTSARKKMDIPTEKKTERHWNGLQRYLADDDDVDDESGKL